LVVLEFRGVGVDIILFSGGLFCVVFSGFCAFRELWVLWVLGGFVVLLLSMNLRVLVMVLFLGFVVWVGVGYVWV